MPGKGGPGAGMRELEEEFNQLCSSSAKVGSLSQIAQKRLDEITAEINQIKKDMKPEGKPGHGPGPRHGQDPGPKGGKGKPPEMTEDMKARMEEDKVKFEQVEALLNEGIKLFN